MTILFIGLVVGTSLFFSVLFFVVMSRYFGKELQRMHKRFAEMFKRIDALNQLHYELVADVTNHEKQITEIRKDVMEIKKDLKQPNPLHKKIKKSNPEDNKVKPKNTKKVKQGVKVAAETQNENSEFETISPKQVQNEPDYAVPQAPQPRGFTRRGNPTARVNL